MRILKWSKLANSRSSFKNSSKSAKSSRNNKSSHSRNKNLRKCPKIKKKLLNSIKLLTIGKVKTLVQCQEASTTKSKR